MTKWRVVWAVTALAAIPGSAWAQEGGFALNQLQPTPAGDVFFGVPGPQTSGHLEPPKGYIMFDYAHRPVRTGDTPVVDQFGHMRLDVSWALWNRLLISVDAPLAIMLKGEDPGITGTTFTELDGPSFGDLRIGLRGRIWGDDGGPFQIGLGSYLFTPTGDQQQYTGEGAVRGAFHASFGGRVGGDVAFIYNAAVGPEFRAGDSPHAITYGAGAGVIFADDMVQLGGEFVGVTALGDTIFLSAAPAAYPVDAGSDLELLFGGKLRFLEGLTVGAVAGPGLGTGVGTPLFRVMGMVGWTPFPSAPPEGEGGDNVAKISDGDDDGIADNKDACPDKAGEPNLDPAKDGCPPSDQDGDDVQDVDDACPDVAGLANSDLTQNGCPADSDGDSVHDGIDHCPKVAGDFSDDPKLNGCPADQDADQIADKEDACPTHAGEPNDDDDKNGCPDDPDNDGIRFAADKCPYEKGEPNENPTRYGCLRHAMLDIETGQIRILQRIEFQTYGSTLSDSVTPNSVKVLRDVAQIINDHPEILMVEVQGHTDDSGEDQYNLELSQKRAEVIKQWLHEKGGVSPERLEPRGYGAKQPVADNRTKAGRQENRRVQFVVKKVDPKKTKKGSESATVKPEAAGQ